MLQFDEELDKGFGQYTENFEGSFKLKVENFFDVPEKVQVDSDVFEFCGFKFRLEVSPKGNFYVLSHCTKSIIIYFPPLNLHC